MSLVRQVSRYERVPYETSIDLRAMEDDDVLADLAATVARLAELVELHFVASLTFAEVARSMLVNCERLLSLSLVLSAA